MKCKAKIADVRIAFANLELISLLKTRGKWLLEGNQNKYVETMNKIVEKRRDDKENGENYKRPLVAFITFYK